MDRFHQGNIPHQEKTNSLADVKKRFHLAGMEIERNNNEIEQLLHVLFNIKKEDVNKFFENSNKDRRANTNATTCNEKTSDNKAPDERGYRVNCDKPSRMPFGLGSNDVNQTYPHEKLVRDCSNTNTNTKDVTLNSTFSTKLPIQLSSTRDETFTEELMDSLTKNKVSTVKLSLKSGPTNSNNGAMFSQQLKAVIGTSSSATTDSGKKRTFVLPRVLRRSRNSKFKTSSP